MKGESGVPNSRKGIFLKIIHFLILQTVEDSRKNHQEYEDLICITHDKKGSKAFNELKQAELVESRQCGHPVLTLLGVSVLAEKCRNPKARVFAHLMPSVFGQ